jgi:hypothetical protein
MRSTATKPKARTEQLIVREVADEVLVYDLTRAKAHCLNKTAASIWRLCDGQSTISEISRRAQDQSAPPVNEHVVWLALEQLNKSHLLQDRLVRPTGTPRITRRDLMRTLGLTAAAVPVIFSIVAPLAAQAGTCAPTNTCCDSEAHGKLTCCDPAAQCVGGPGVPAGCNKLCRK